MLFSNTTHGPYEKAPAHEVICQLRFPTILSINTTEPADFQELIREDYPTYVRRQETTPPKLVGMGTDHPQLQQAPPVSNYNFLSADNKWRLNLTRDFIALSTLAYPGWQDFAHHLDKALAAFIRLYKPAGFQRIGLRYVNIFSRSTLGLEDQAWGQLMAPAYTGVLREPDVREEDCLNCATDLLLRLDNSCQAKIHAGPGRVKNPVPNAPQDPEVKFLLDLDLSMNGPVNCELSAAALETLHCHATSLFEGALTPPLRQALEG